MCQAIRWHTSGRADMTTLEKIIYVADYMEPNRDFPGVEELVAALLAGPTQEGLVSPFPQGLSLQDWELADGLLTLNFSEQYGGLADVSLTLADYCLVLTLGQIEGVDTVQIQSAGHTYHSRSHQTLKPGEAVLDQTLPEEVLRAAGAES